MLMGSGEARLLNDVRLSNEYLRISATRISCLAEEWRPRVPLPFRQLEAGTEGAPVPNIGQMPKAKLMIGGHSH